MNFNVIKSVQCAALTAGLATAAFVGGGAMIRNNNKEAMPNDIETLLVSMEHDMKDSNIKQDIEVSENFGKIINTLGAPTPDIDNKISSLRDSIVKNDERYDLRCADNDLERTAVKAYAMSRLAANKVQDTFNK